MVMLLTLDKAVMISPITCLFWVRLPIVTARFWLACCPIMTATPSVQLYWGLRLIPWVVQLALGSPLAAKTRETLLMRMLTFERARADVFPNAVAVTVNWARSGSEATVPAPTIERTFLRQQSLWAWVRAKITKRRAMAFILYQLIVPKSKGMAFNRILQLKSSYKSNISHINIMTFHFPILQISTLSN